MKEPTLAPFYAVMYPGLCDIARKHGYALAIHGTMSRDCDFVAIPWVEEASDADVLADALRTHVNALLYPDLLAATAVGLTATHIQKLIDETPKDPTLKPHGRLAWCLHLHCGAYVDLSVLPKLAK